MTAHFWKKKIKNTKKNGCAQKGEVNSEILPANVYIA